MSFSGEVKEELARNSASARHCRIAELAALAAFSGEVLHGPDGTKELLFKSENKNIVLKCARLMKQLFGVLSDIREEKTSRQGKTAFSVRQSEPRIVAKILQTIHYEDEAEPLRHRLILQKNCCRRAYVRGAFLASGSISDPNRSYHFEIVCGKPEQAEQLADLLRSLEIEARNIRRKDHYIVYVKDSTQISDLLGLMGASVSLLSYENARVVREVRGNVNRKVNCEMANISKTANASVRQLEDIRLIQKTIGLSALPKGLDEIAAVRLQYPVATLKELGDLLDPPIGKSGVNHRLRKLSVIAESLKGNQGGGR